MSELMTALGKELGIEQQKEESNEEYFNRIKEYVKEHQEQGKQAMDKVVNRKPSFNLTEDEIFSAKYNLLYGVIHGFLRVFR